MVINFSNIGLEISGEVYFFPPLLAFLASISFFAAKRFLVLCGRVEVFFFGLNAIIRVIFDSI